MKYPTESNTSLGQLEELRRIKHPGNTTAIHLECCFISLILTEQLVLLSNISIRTQNDQEQFPCSMSVQTYLWS